MGVQAPCPKKKLDTSAAMAPTMKPLCLPRVAPATMAMADTGLTSGTGAKRMRPAAATAPSVAVGRICLSAGRDAS